MSEIALRNVCKQFDSEHYGGITNVSHDIKTPLTSIINYADLIGKEVSGDIYSINAANHSGEYSEQRFPRR